MPKLVRRRASPTSAVITLLFAAGITASLGAQAQGTGTSTSTGARIIDLQAMTDAEVGPIQPNHGTLRSKTLLKTPNGTIAVQAGDSPKHYHAETDEIQYVISGTGKFWLGDTMRDVHPGDVIIIPKGTNHAGSHASEGNFKVLSIKLPPQAEDDFHRVP
ncbi:cupin domain-containing protein [Robbsia sp. Bb-Pol-6]|uniref:Cupin domain-containing protein n=1 Tax=Robbsia betulipollinis TaxID=2981849 RepID=A0ABT3ZRG9_9BURK|nr:cupin domain-containing protein [Robbsia betulipollinis]MCY0389149.1 cupin domain-containing protein [Robbsia betulipollinis]